MNKLLIENRASKNRSAARDEIRNIAPSYDADEFEYKIIHDIPNIRFHDFALEKYFIHYLFSQEFGSTNEEGAESIFFINDILALSLNPEYKDMVFKYFNGEDLDELKETFYPIFEELYQKDIKRSRSMTFNENKDYNIVYINDADDMQKYSSYIDWCVLDQDNLDNYTRMGKGAFYVCERNGWQNVEKVAGQDAPLDEYGLSLIGVSVKPNGACNTITTRWNHENGGSDYSMSVEQLENIIGRSFYNTFKVQNYGNRYNESIMRMNNLNKRLGLL